MQQRGPAPGDAQRRQLYDEALSPCGLRTTQYGLLATIRGLGIPTMGELAEAMVMDLSGSAIPSSPWPGRLRRRGGGPARPPARRIALTEAGAAKLAEATPLWRDAQIRFEAAFGAERAALLRDLLHALALPDFRDAFEGRERASPLP